MKIRIPLISLLLVLVFPFFSLAQTSVISGKLQDSDTKATPSGALITLDGTNLRTKADTKGEFELIDVAYGTYTLVVNADSYGNSTSFSVVVNGPKVDMGIVRISHTSAVNENDAPVTNESEELELPTISLNETVQKESSSTNFNSTRDPYESAVLFNFSALRYRARGYRNSEVQNYMNGIALEDLASGRSNYTVGGLGSVMYGRDRAYGLNASTFSFGGLDGASTVNTRASAQRKQFQIAYSTSNGNYTNRIAATYGTGLMKGGWAFSSSVVKSWANEGYIPGNYSDGWMWYMSLDKHIGKNHILSLTQIGGNTSTAVQGRATEEVFKLTGDHYYNPNWGYQNGKVRNAVVNHRQQPLTVLSHEWILNTKSTIKSAIGYQFGENARSNGDYFNALSPSPIYYRNLPSFQDNPGMAALVAQAWKDDVNKRQINWDNLYNQNANSNPETVTNVEGIAGNDVTGQRSHYVTYDEITSTKSYSFNTVYSSKLNDKHTLTAGYSYQYQQNEYFKRLTDLLGGDFYVDQNQYAELAYPDSIEVIQNDLNHPNRILHVGDKYGYDYKSTNTKHKFWLQDQFKFDRIEGYVAGQLISTSFFRTGLVRNGVFPENSYGDSKKKNFLNAGIKGGLLYRLGSTSHVYLNGEYETKAPTFQNSFVSTRTRNDLIDGIRSEVNYSVEGGYMLRTPNVKFRATGYYTQLNHESRVTSFYHDDYRTNVNYNLTNIDTRFIGLELGTEITLGGGLTANGALGLSQNYYTSRYKATITQDNSSVVLADNETVYSKNFYVSNAGPQTVASAGLRYRSRNFWTLNLTGNYFANSYSGFNPARRTIAGVDQLTEGSQQWNDVIDQTKLADQFTLDFYGTYSWRLNNQFNSLKKRTYLILNVGVKNLLDNQNIVLASGEQSRFDFTEKNVNKFAPRFQYAYGAIYTVRVILRLN